MTTLPWHPSQGPEMRPPDDVATAGRSHRARDGQSSRDEGLNRYRADCCVARAAYRVVLPAQQPHRSSELLLCGHHFRDYRLSLERRHAVVFDVHNKLVESVPAF